MGFPFGLSGMGTGAALVAIGVFDPNPKRSVGLITAGIGVAILSARSAVGNVLDKIAEVKEQAGSEAQLPGIGGVVGRALVGNPEPELTVSMRVPSGEGPFLGHPKNISRVSGKIHTPGSGELLERVTLGRNYRIKAYLENQSSSPTTGTPELWVREHGVMGSLGPETDIKVSGGLVELEPGALYAIEGTIPAALVFSLFGGPLNAATQRFGAVSFDVDSTARLLWEGHIIDKVEFARG